MVYTQSLGFILILVIVIVVINTLDAGSSSGNTESSQTASSSQLQSSNGGDNSSGTVLYIPYINTNSVGRSVGWLICCLNYTCLYSAVW